VTAIVYVWAEAENYWPASASDPADPFADAHRHRRPDVSSTSNGKPTFLQVRFGPWYGTLRAPGLDADRLRFYELAQSPSLIEGPLRLAGTDFPHPELMLDIAGCHIAKVLRIAG
jgi:hypothetical protein